MPTERDHHSSKDRALQIVVIPQGDTGSTSSFKASVLTIVLAGCATVALVIGLTVAAIIYTPAGLLIPISEEQLQKHYGTQLFDVQQRLNRLSSEVLVLRDYNNKLRKALGQQDLPADSSFNFQAMNSVAVETPGNLKEEETAKPVKNQKPELSSESNIVYRTVVSEKEEVSFKASFPITTPAVGYVSRKFEMGRGHLGIDYAGKIGSLIVSAADGFVIFAGYTVDDGQTIIVSHGSGYLTIYKHNQSILKSVGEMVKRGEPIALLGNSGRTSYGPHLHFELWKDGQARNPNDYLIASEL